MLMQGQISIFDKPRIKFTEDDTSLCKDFKLGTEWELFMEQTTHWVIYHNKVYYHPFKNLCEKV